MAGNGGEQRVSSRAVSWTITALLVLSVPWYFPAGDGSPFVFGVPLWCFVSFGCCTAIAAIVVAFLPLLWGDVADEEPR